MGYNTDFYGSIFSNKRISDAHYDEYQDFIEEKSAQDPFNYNYCDWEIQANNWSIEYNGKEKFYYYFEWMKLIIEEFFKPRGYIMNGEIESIGEGHHDFGKIVVENNVVSKKIGRIIYD